MSLRPVKSETLARPTIEGAGVHLYRAFGFHEPQKSDPFLLLDDFRNDDPAAYAKGFPWHPHRGIETIIPTVIDQNPCAHLRMPRDMIFHGWSMRLFQAWQHSATMSS